MADRALYSGSSTPPLAPGDFLDQYQERLKDLLDGSFFQLTSVAGTVDAVTSVVDPTLDGDGLVNGMKFTITWAGTNTAGVTLVVGSESAADVLDKEGNALVAGAVESGLTSVLEYRGGDFYVLTEVLVGGGSGSTSYFDRYTANDTWTKPAGLDDDRPVLVRLWAAGGGGRNSGGGGGGGYVEKWFKAVDLPSSVAVGIGAGGTGTISTAAGDGGNTTFGSLLTAYGGQAGQASTGGNGGGEIETGADGGKVGGGVGGSGADGGDAGTIWGGGGAGQGTSGSPTTGRSGGNAVNGGGGGGGSASGSYTNVGPGGQSVNGGRGGDSGDGTPVPEAGVAPGGGGGGGNASNAGGNGARGQLEVIIP